MIQPAQGDRFERHAANNDFSGGHSFARPQKSQNEQEKIDYVKVTDKYVKLKKMRTEQKVAHSSMAAGT